MQTPATEIPFSEMEKEVTDKIVPVTGDCTSKFFNGDESRGEMEDTRRVTYDVCRILDGLHTINADFDIIPVRGFVQAIAKETAFTGPCVGLKIHVAIPWNDPKFIDVFEKIALLCNTPNKDGKFATFKVMFPGNQKALLEQEDLQGSKSITINPNYLGDEKTNMTETVRLVAGLRKIMEEENYNPTTDQSKIAASERYSGSGIYIRPAQITAEGYNYQKADRDESFDAQMGNLYSPRTDGDMFRKQVDEAIEKGDI